MIDKLSAIGTSDWKYIYRRYIAYYKGKKLERKLENEDRTFSDRDYVFVVEQNFIYMIYMHIMTFWKMRNSSKEQYVSKITQNRKTIT